jgi:hypothetical protein
MAVHHYNTNEELQAAITDAFLSLTLCRAIVSTFQGDPPDDTLHPWSPLVGLFLPFISSPTLTFGMQPEFTWIAVYIFLTAQQPGFEGWASEFCFGLYIKISFRQVWVCVCIDTALQSVRWAG